METLRLLDLRLLLAWNGVLAARPHLFRAALFLTDHGADLALLVTTAFLWFRPTRSVPTREEARGRLIVFGTAAIAAYVAARLIAMRVDALRPFASWVPVHGTPGAFDGLRTYGTFPSDHAALLGALPFAFAPFSGPLGVLWAVVGVVLAATRIAVGFHYPSDMLAGGAIGALAGAASLLLFRTKPVHSAALRVARGFSKLPHAVFLYLAVALVGIEFAFHFRHLLALLVWLRWRLT
jgi:membrane-associated phospholipid phosphatase